MGYRDQRGRISLTCGRFTKCSYEDKVLSPTDCGGNPAFIGEVVAYLAKRQDHLRLNRSGIRVNHASTVTIANGITIIDIAGK